MAKVYDLLSITDTSTRDMRFTLRDVGKNDLALNIDYGHAQLRGEMLSLIEQGAQFKRCLFSTHGNSGFIVFGREWIDTVTWYQEFYPRAFDRLFPFPNTKLLFNGCNIADGTEGWKFLEAAARSLLRIGGGTAIGWTSKGFASIFRPREAFMGRHEASLRFRRRR